jgi:hypothetical protein
MEHPYQKCVEEILGVLGEEGELHGDVQALGLAIALREGWVRPDGNSPTDTYGVFADAGRFAVHGEVIEMLERHGIAFASPAAQRA